MCEDPVPNAVRGDVPDPQLQRGTGPREVVPPPAVKPPNQGRCTKRINVQQSLVQLPAGVFTVSFLPAEVS